MTDKISVFGSTGFVGSNWMELYGDISFAEERSSVVPKCSDVLYFRGTNSNYNVYEDVKLDIETNLLLFVETLENFAKNPDRKVFNLISSWFVDYPKGFYSATKLCQEHLMESYCKTFDVSYKIIRLCGVMGFDKGASAKKNALMFMLEKVMRGEDVNLYKGDNYRNLLDVETCCRAIKFVMDNGEEGETYNIGNTQSYRIEDLILYAIQKTRSKSRITYIDVPRFHSIVQQENYWMDTSKLQSLGFDNEVNIYNQIDQILEN